jgi:ComF family protein
MEGVLAIFDYKNDKVKKVVEAIKFGFNRELVEIVLSGWKAPKKWEKVVVVPVPLHRYRQNWRGFNQAEEIARRVAGKKMVVVRVLKRIKATAQQANVTFKKKRLENLKGCFAVDQDKLKLIYGKKVLLVDDVFTSGATMRECARELHKAGIKSVWGLVLAR